MGLFSRIVHHGKLIDTDSTDPETGRILTVLLPMTLWGEPMRLTLPQAQAFGKNYQDIGWDAEALEVPTMEQLKVVFTSRARNHIPADDYQSRDVLSLKSRPEIQMNHALSFHSGRTVLSSPRATCGTILVFS